MASTHRCFQHLLLLAPLAVSILCTLSVSKFLKAGLFPGHLVLCSHGKSMEQEGIGGNLKSSPAQGFHAWDGAEQMSVQSNSGRFQRMQLLDTDDVSRAGIPVPPSVNARDTSHQRMRARSRPRVNQCEFPLLGNCSRMIGCSPSSQSGQVFSLLPPPEMTLLHFTCLYPE